MTAKRDKRRLASDRAEGRPAYLVIRVATINDRDVIDELDKVIGQHGHAWFGKYGKPLGRRYASEQPRPFLFLTQTGDIRKSAIYPIAAFSNTLPTDRAYPGYYRSFLGQIRTWIKITHSILAPVTLNDLIVASSQVQLTESLRKSSSSHFLCLALK